MTTTNGDSRFQVKLGDVARFQNRTQAPQSPPQGGDRFPPLFIDATRLSDDVLQRTLDKLVEHSATEPFTVRFRAGRAFAAAVLLRSKGNVRPLSEATRDAYCRDMEAGNFPLTGETVKFTTDGAMVDAHHRMCALGDSNAVIDVMVFFGMPPEAVSRIDQGNRRRQSAVLGLSAKDVSIIRAAMTARNGGRPKKWTNDEVVSGAALFADARETLPSPNAHAAPVWGVIWNLYKSDPGKCQAFAQELLSSETAQMHSSTRLLRRTLLVSDSAGASNGWRVALYTMVAARAFIEDRPITKLLLKDGEIRQSDSDGGVYGWFMKRIRS